MSAVDIRSKVQQWLDELFNGVEVQEDGAVFVPGFGTTALFVSVDDVFDSQYVRVLVDAPILMDVPATSELFEYIGVRSSDFVFGNFAFLRDREGVKTGILTFRQSLLGDAIDKVELEVAAKVVAITADDLDEDLKMRFGGRKFYD